MLALFKTLILPLEELFVKAYKTNTSWGALKVFLAALSVLIVCNAQWQTIFVLLYYSIMLEYMEHAPATK